MRPRGWRWLRVVHLLGEPAEGGGGLAQSGFADRVPEGAAPLRGIDGVRCPNARTGQRKQLGYGYRTWQAGLWLLGLMLAVAAVFAHAYPAHMIATSRHPMPFNALIYALDVLLPVISLGQQASWQPAGMVLGVYWALIILGWALTSALVAGLTGIVKQD